MENRYHTTLSITIADYTGIDTRQSLIKSNLFPKFSKFQSHILINYMDYSKLRMRP